MSYYKRIQNYAIDKNGRYIPGSSNNFSVIEKNENPADKDTDNRKRVLKSIEEHIKNGKTLEEAAEIISSNEEIKKQFEYLTRVGIELSKTFESWYTGFQKSKSKLQNLYTRGTALSETAAKTEDYR